MSHCNRLTGEYRVNQNSVLSYSGLSLDDNSIQAENKEKEEVKKLSDLMNKVAPKMQKLCVKIEELEAENIALTQQIKEEREFPEAQIGGSRC